MSAVPASVDDMTFPEPARVMAATELDPAQRRVIDARVDASATVIGAPGTGKTTALTERVVRLLNGRDSSVASPPDAPDAPSLTVDEVLVLTPHRRGATALRDVIGARLTAATPGAVARSLGSFAFQVVRAEMVRRGDEPPALLTGADQDRVIADLLAGDAEDERAGRPSRWPENLEPVVRSSRDFRSELRAFFAECAEESISIDELRSTGHPAWQAVASFLQEYRGVLDQLRGAHRDAADLLAEAAVILADRSTPGPFDSVRVVLVDDAQELTPGGIAVLAALRKRGVAVMAFGDPDIASGAFRGASPERFAEMTALLGPVIVLETPHRQAPALTDLTRTVTQAIGAAGQVDHRRAPVGKGDASSPEAGTQASVETFLAPSPHEEIDRIAGVLRDWNLDGGIAWDRMAVIAHDTRQVTLLETELAAREVPTRAAGVQRPVGRETVVRDIVSIVRLALKPVELRDIDELSEALRSPFGGLDGVGLRRLRARLRQNELREGGRTSARVLLAGALAEPAQLVLIDAPEARAAERFARLLQALSAGAAQGETIHELLWRVWDTARSPDGRALADAWAHAATQPGGAEIARALDALVALFGAAKRFTERSPHDGPEPFIVEILDSEVPEDTLAAPERAGSVALLTPATALGTEYDAVVLAGVQDGVWPNVRLRGGLLDTWRLPAAIAAARGGHPELAPNTVDRRRAALHDELRLFVRAISRARRRLLITAVDDDDHAPSVFFGFLPEPPPPAMHAAAAHPLTLRGLVARHRRTLTSSTIPEHRAHAAEQLAVLAREGVPGADPAEWYGMRAPSSEGPLNDFTDRPVRVSPSRLEAFETCALDWVISTLGGAMRSSAAGVGTILHAAMEQVPEGDADALAQVVDERWGELEFDAPWLAVRERRRADELTSRLRAYLARVRREHGETSASELRFELDIDLDAPQGPTVVGARVLGTDGRWQHISVPSQATPVTASTVHARVSPNPENISPEVTSGTAEAPEVVSPPILARAVLSGSIDRVEVYPPERGENLPAGSAHRRAVVVDLKTGKYENRYLDQHVVDHAQLAAYQLAYEQGVATATGVRTAPSREDSTRHETSATTPTDTAELAGARLVLLSKTSKDARYRIAHQATLTEESRGEFLQRLGDAARGMAGEHFVANIDTHCTTDRFAVCTVHTIKAVSAP